MIIRQWVLGENDLNYITFGDILFLWIEHTRATSVGQEDGAISGWILSEVALFSASNK